MARKNGQRKRYNSNNKDFLWKSYEETKENNDFNNKFSAFEKSIIKGQTNTRRQHW